MRPSFPGFLACILLGLLTCIVAIFVYAFKQANNESIYITAQYMADKIVKSIVYVKDPRTNICFACLYYEDGRIISIASVLEEVVPRELLFVAEIHSLEKK